MAGDLIPERGLTPAYPERAPWGTAERLRAWQEEALTAYFADRPGPDGAGVTGTGPRDFLAAATPGAGKTTFALRLAATLLERRAVDRITVVAPTEHLKVQWADAAARAGLRLNPRYRNGEAWNAGRGRQRMHGVVVTYAQVAADPALHRRITESGRTLVVLDEVHHGGDALSWGDAVREAFAPAERRLGLTGTPFRSDDAPIPFVGYEPMPDGSRMSITDYRYGYGRALRDGVVRPVVFLAYEGGMRWRTRMGEEMEARLGQPDTKDVTQAAWRTALDPGGDWIRAVLTAADRRLTIVRHTVPDAGGLVIATDQRAARAYAGLLREIAGETPVVVLSDDAGASERIEAFAAGEQRWLVAVRMVSEGVDVPRLSVGVYATSAATPLYFAQAIGRFVRARRRGETASVFLPSVPQLLGMAAELERERDHVLGAPREAADFAADELAAANAEDRASERLAEEFEWQALASEAEFGRVLYDGDEFGFAAFTGSEDELDFLSIPGLLTPEELREALRHRQARQSRRAEGHGDASRAPAHPPALFRTLAEQRTLLHSLVGLQAKRTGQPHGHIHAELRRLCGGPEVARASVAQLQSRIDRLRGELHG